MPFLGLQLAGLEISLRKPQAPTTIHFSLNEKKPGASAKLKKARSNAEVATKSKGLLARWHTLSGTAQVPSWRCGMQSML